MDMVLVGAYFKKVYLKPVLHFETGLLQDHVHWFGDDDSPIFSRADEVIYENADIMAFVDVYTHVSQYIPAASRGVLDPEKRIIKRPRVSLEGETHRVMPVTACNRRSDP